MPKDEDLAISFDTIVQVDAGIRHVIDSENYSTQPCLHDQNAHGASDVILGVSDRRAAAGLH